MKEPVWRVVDVREIERNRCVIWSNGMGNFLWLTEDTGPGELLTFESREEAFLDAEKYFEDYHEVVEVHDQLVEERQIRIWKHKGLYGWGTGSETEQEKKKSCKFSSLEEALEKAESIVAEFNSLVRSNIRKSETSVFVWIATRATQGEFDIPSDLNESERHAIEKLVEKSFIVVANGEIVFTNRGKDLANIMNLKF
jgi:hypothetical protein